MRFLQALLQILVFSSSFLNLSPALAQEQAAAPIFQEGDTWQFKVTLKGVEGPSSVSVRTYEIVYANGDFQVYVFGGKGKQRAGSQNLLYLVGKAEGESLKAYLQFPLFVGKEWRVEYEFTNMPGHRRLMQGGAGVTKIEDINTPAGNFRTFKIERQENGVVATAFGVWWRWFFTSTYYYSPETRSIVKLHWETSGDANLQVRDTELIRFSHNSGSTEKESVSEGRGEPAVADR